MKFLVLVGDGMADFPLDELSGRTPLEVADTQQMDGVVRRGILGRTNTIPDGLPPGSDIGNLSLFGYDPRRYFSGRAPLEAANLGIPLDGNKVAFRCNLVTVQDQRMVDFACGHISTPEAAALISALNSTMGSTTFRVYSGTSYRHIAVFSPRDDAEATRLQKLACTPPHDITGEKIEPHLPQGEGADTLRELMSRSAGILATHEVNLARKKDGKAPATMVWLWGQGRSPKMPSYSELFGLSGAVISAVDLVKGIARFAGLDVVNVEGATGYLDTNYQGKVEAAIRALRDKDFAFVHVEAPDETSHEGDAGKKIQAIEDFDRRVVGPAVEQMEQFRDYRIMVTTDHVTSIVHKTHRHGDVPFAIMGSGIKPSTGTKFSEREAERAGLYIKDGHELVRFFMGVGAKHLSDNIAHVSKGKTDK